MKSPSTYRRAWLLLPLLALSLWFAWSLGDGSGQRDVEGGSAPLRVGEDSAPVEELTRVANATSTAERVEASTVEVQEPETGIVADDGTWSLHGRVLDPAGRRVAGALVALISLHEDVPGNRGDREAVHADEYGMFELSVPEWARDKRVLLAARRSGWQPYSERLLVDSVLTEHELSLQLGIGNEISGRVVRDGMPVGEAQVSFDCAYGTGGVFGAGSEAWWANGRLEEKHGNLKTDLDGQFKLEGMGPGEHRLHIDLPRGELPSITGRTFSAQAPEFRVYDLSGARLAISVSDSSGVVANAQLHVSCNQSGVQLTSAFDPVQVEVPPDATIQVEVTHPTSRPVRMQVESPPVGQLLELMLPLEIVERPSLSVRIPGAKAAGVSRIRLRLQVLHGFSDDEFEAPMGETADTFELETVPLDPQGYNLILEPCDDGGSAKFLTPRTQEIQLPESGNLFVEFGLGFSGRVSVDIDSTHEQDWTATYRIVDEDGHQLHDRTIYHSAPIQFEGEDGELYFEEMVMMDSFNFRGGSKFSWHEDAGRVARRCGLIPSGSYTLEVESKGHAMWSAPITIEAGKTSHYKLSLTPSAR